MGNQFSHWIRHKKSFENGLKNRNNLLKPISSESEVTCGYSVTYRNIWSDFNKTGDVNFSCTPSSINNN